MTNTNHVCCSIIPPYLLANIADHPDATDDARTFARNSLIHTQFLAQTRDDTHQQILASGEGGGQAIIPGHILTAISDAGDVDEGARDAAQRTLVISEGLRDDRERHADNLRAAAAAAADTEADASAAAPKRRLKRVIYSSENTEILDERLVRSEGQPDSEDTSVNEAYDGFGATFEFYHKFFGRNSIDDRGMSLIASVHYGKKYINAFWNGSQMVFGDGDGGVYWNKFTAAIDVIAHELTHGVTAYTANLIYRGESGALNESLSDVFGSMVKQYHLNQTAADADWLIGEGLFTKRVKGVALRSMKAPGTAYDDPILGKDRQPDNYANVVPLSDAEDSGGVHIYSGVPNRAFYLVAVALGGYSWEKAGKIWYETSRDKRLKANANFEKFAGLTVDNAQKLYGAEVKDVVEKAWKDVGVKVGKLV